MLVILHDLPVAGIEAFVAAPVDDMGGEMILGSTLGITV